MRSSSQTKKTIYPNIEAAIASLPRTIQVSGLQCFEWNRWREAILYYLFGIWGNKQEVTYRPKISFDGTTLRLDTSTKTYFAYGESKGEEWPHVGSPELVVVGCRREDVELGLVKFVKDESIKALTIVLGEGGGLFLWKGKKRSHLGIACRGIPTAEEWSKSQT